MPRNGALIFKSSFNINAVRNFNTMTYSFEAAWYQASNMASWVLDAIHYAIKKCCLAMHKIAGPCQTQKQKNQH